MKNYLWLTSCLIFVLFVSTACFRETGDSDLEGTPVARLLPTNTEVPTDTPEPTETPTETPTEAPTEEETEEVEIQLTEEATVEVTEDFGAQVIEPEVTFDIGVTEVAQLEETPLDLPLQQDPIEPDDLTATQLIADATNRALWQTQTAEAPFIVPTATATPEFFATPTFTAQPTTTTGQVPVSGSDCVHEVVAGENMYRLSIRYGVPIMDIANRSGVTNPAMIIVGQRLTIPGCGTTGVFPPPTSVSLDSASGTDGGTTGGAGTGSGGGRIHVVAQYETLFQISVLYNVPITTIMAANPSITNPNIIYFGQELVIP